MAGIDSLTEKLNKTLETDFKYYGLKGLVPNSLLYRVCRDDEDLSSDILSKARGVHDQEIYTVEQHMNCGSRKRSRFISTTASPDVARDWAFYAKDDKDVKKRKKPQRIVKIHLSKIPEEQKKTLINLTNEEVRNHFVKGAIHRSRAISSKEVIFQWKIPKIMFEIWENPPEPSQPPKSPKLPKKCP